MEYILPRERLEEHADFAREINVERDKMSLSYEPLAISVFPTSQVVVCMN